MLAWPSKFVEEQKIKMNIGSWPGPDYQVTDPWAQMFDGTRASLAWSTVIFLFFSLINVICFKSPLSDQFIKFIFSPSLKLVSPICLASSSPLHISALQVLSVRLCVWPPHLFSTFQSLCFGQAQIQQNEVCPCPYLSVHTYLCGQRGKYQTMRWLPGCQESYHCGVIQIIHGKAAFLPLTAEPATCFIANMRAEWSELF